jgi:2-polyprenyl-3-methyl-5-hydroxy-6-metoxy-1,4-benzoquinol methylase
MNSRKTIEDFGNQWNIFTKNEGYYGSSKILVDICGNIFNPKNFSNSSVLDIGAGTGRLTNILIELGAKHVYSVEPSSAYNVLLNETKKNKKKITYIQSRGDNIPLNFEIDFAISIGVLHHIPNPELVCKRAYKLIKPNGEFFIWVYAKEGNELYLFFVHFLRKFTSRMSDKALLKLCKFLNFFLNIYCIACTKIKLPMFTYMRNHIAKLSNEVRILTIFDQLNPQYSKYYTKEETINLLKDAGFRDIRIEYRHKYSWSAVGKK